MTRWSIVSTAHRFLFSGTFISTYINATYSTPYTVHPMHVVQYATHGTPYKVHHVHRLYSNRICSTPFCISQYRQAPHPRGRFTVPSPECEVSPAVAQVADLGALCLMNVLVCTIPAARGAGGHSDGYLSFCKFLHLDFFQCGLCFFSCIFVVGERMLDPVSTSALSS